MSWKNWPSWLKSGLYGLIPIFLLTIYNLIIFLIFRDYPSNIYFSHWQALLIIFIYYPGIIITGLVADDLNIPNPLVEGEVVGNIYLSLTLILFINVIIYIFIGAFIGWLYGKYKAKKQQPIQPQVQTK